MDVGWGIHDAYTRNFIKTPIMNLNWKNLGIGEKERILNIFLLFTY